jgi:RNA processing factor Prp31
MNESKAKLGDLVATLCQTNMELWREEDKARFPEDATVVQAKRNIDKLNQKRNDLIEKIDDWFLSVVQKGH